MYSETNRKGISTELRCMATCADLGYEVLTPYGNTSRYDFAIDINGHFYRVQCKHSKESTRQGSFIFETRSVHTISGKKVYHVYTKEEIDYFATMWDGKCYLIPIEECGKGAKTLRFAHCLTKQKEGKINWATDYELEKVLGELEEKLAS